MKTALFGVGAIGLAAGLWWLLRAPTPEETARTIAANNTNPSGGRQLVVMPVLSTYLTRPAPTT